MKASGPVGLDVLASWWDFTSQLQREYALRRQWLLASFADRRPLMLVSQASDDPTIVMQDFVVPDPGLLGRLHRISEALGRVYVMRNEDDLSLTIVCETFVQPNPQTQVEVGAVVLARWLLS